MIQLWVNDDMDLRQFAFLDTVTDQFVNLDGSEVWMSAAAFVEDYKEEAKNLGREPWGSLERFTEKLGHYGWKLEPTKEVTP